MPEGFDLGKAFASIELDASGIAKGIASAKKTVSQGIEDIGSSMQSIGGNMTLLGAPFLAFGAMAVKSFTDSQDALAQLDAVLKSTTSSNGEFITSTAASADEIEELNGKLSDATEKLTDMQTVYDSNTEHTTAQTLALEKQKKKVAELSAAVAEGNRTTTTQINVTHMSRDALVELATSLQSVTTFSDETVLAAESMLLTFTNIGEKVFPEATKTVLDMSQALGQDAKNSAIQLGKALNDPIKGVTALQRVGVTFTESQKEMIKQLVQAGKVEEAQKVILQELQKEFGGSAEAAGKTFAGQLARVRNQIDDVMEGIGEKLIPVVTSLVNHIVDLVNWFATLDPHIQDIIIGIGVLFASLAIIGPVIAAIGTAIGAVSGILAGIGTVIGVILSPIGLLIAAGAAIVFLFKDQIGTALGIAWDYLQRGEGLFKSLAAGIVALFGDNTITQAISGVLVGIQDFFDHFQDKVKLYGSLIWLYFQYYITNPLGDFWNTYLKPAFDAFAAWFQTDGLPGITTALQLFQDTIWNPIVDLIKGIWDKVKGELDNFANWFKSGGLQEIANGLKAFDDNAIKPFIKAVNYIWDQAKPGLELMKIGFKAAFDWIVTNVIEPAMRKLDSFLEKLIPLNSLGTGNQQGGSTGAGVYDAAINNPGWKAYIDKNKPNSPNIYSGGSFGSGVVPIPKVGEGSAAPPKRDFGGAGAAGMPYLIGKPQMGNEVFIPQSNGTFVPDFAKMMAGAGGGFNMHGDIIIQANSAAEGRAGMSGALDEIEQRWRSRGN